MKKSFLVTFGFSLMLYMIFINNSYIVKADADGNVVEVGVAVVGDYSDWKDLNNLKAPIQVGEDIDCAFEYGNAKSWRNGFWKKNSKTTINLFKAKSLGGKDDQYADNVDLLFYAGHALKPKYHGAIDYSFALDYNKGKKYAKQSEMYLGNRDLEWLVTFSCNFCKGGLKSVGHASVFTAKSCANDCIWGYGKVASDPKNYSVDPSLYVMMLGSKGILPPTDATDCYIAMQFPQSYKHLQSRIFASKSASCRCLAGQASR